MTLQQPFLHEDKKNLLNVSSITPVEENLSISALTILKERYLLKDDTGNIVERPHELFARVAVGVGIMEVLYLPEFYDKEGRYATQDPFFTSFLQKLQNELKDLNYKDMYDHPLCIALPYGFTSNPFHYERLLARYLELVGEGRMKTSFDKIFDRLIKDGDLKLKIIPLIQKYYDLMASGVFLPNTPALMNCGTKLGMNAACFTLRMKDDLVDIFETYTDVAKIFKSGGGIGINYSSLRPEGAYVRGTGGKSSGTLSWLKLMDAVTGSVSQGGKRRGASMGILNVGHPEIEKFIELKDNKTLENHNISICMDDYFMRIFVDNSSSTINNIMNKITQNAWKTGDPGMVFLENMNKNNLLYDVMEGPIDVTNPCSEISMYPYESCILASINLSKFVKEDGVFDIAKFNGTVMTVTQFLDSMIDATKYPIDIINDKTKDCRRIGVGFMGLADTFTKLGVPYNSKEGFLLCEYISAAMTMSALYASNVLAYKKGAFPLWYDKKYPKDKLPVIADERVRQELKNNFKYISKYFSINDHNMLGLFADGLNISMEYGLRNCSVTTVAPTGTLSMLADCSSGIEPLFALEYTKKVTLGDFEYLDRNYEKALQSGMSEEDIKRIFVTTMDIHPFDHLMMQASAQKWITNGISKTINLATDVTSKMIEYAYVLSWALGNKGISVYRDHCKENQVLNGGTGTTSSHQAISEYTTSVIKELDNLPEEYKHDLLNTEYTSNIKHQTSNKIICTNCGTTNMLEKSGRGDSCYICRACGIAIGSCG
jgi:ribonucleoside-diphosphate reductase alpha chain